jgi:hypothetical protein
MLHEVETQEDAVDDALAPADEPQGDACSWCGEPAQNVGECHACGESGCLPPDVWSPGMNEPCLTLCVRCARTIHVQCAAEDEAGNPRCRTCHY